MGWLTHRGRVIHICVSKLVHHWIRLWLGASLAPSHYLNQCWHIVNSTLRKCFKEILFKIQKFSFRKCIWKCRLDNGSHRLNLSVLKHQNNWSYKWTILHFTSFHSSPSSNFDPFKICFYYHKRLFRFVEVSMQYLLNNMYFNIFFLSSIGSGNFLCMWVTSSGRWYQSIGSWEYQLQIYDFKKISIIICHDQVWYKGVAWYDSR